MAEENPPAPTPAPPSTPVGWDQPCVKSEERRGAGAGAMVMFIVSALSIYAFYEISKIASSDLGVSVWTSQDNLKARLTPVATTLITRQTLAGWIAANRLDQQIVPEDKRWKSVSGIAGILTSDEAKDRLVTSWSERLNADTQPLVRSYVTGREARGASIARADVLAALVKGHSEALTGAVSAWVDDELSMLRIYAALQEEDASVPPVAASGAKRVTPPSATPVSPVPEAFVTALRRLATQHLQEVASHPAMKAAITRMIERDLDPLSAQAPLNKAVEEDYSGRWAWTISAAVFLTAALAAIVGGFRRFDDVLDRSQQAVGRAAYVTAIAIAFALGMKFLDSLGPKFLWNPLLTFSEQYGVGIHGAVYWLNGVAAAAIVALLIVAWASFLVETKTVEHLEEQLTLLQWSFQTATFVLVAGVVQMYCLFHWSAPFMSSAAAELVQNGARMWSIASAAVFSMLLLLIYVPGSRILVREAREREARGQDKDKIPSILTKTGFDDTSQQQQITALVKLFAPLIAAQAADLVGLLGN